jgi:hypothetical protein
MLFFSLDGDPKLTLHLTEKNTGIPENESLHYMECAYSEEVDF